MRGRRAWRSWYKAVILLFSLLQCVLSFLPLLLRGETSPEERAVWLHSCCKLVLRRLGFGVSVLGTAPRSGLLVSNHLSYLDILVYGATVPCVFVSKLEVRSWPLLGLLASLGGTVFIDRRSAASAAEAARRIETLLTAGLLVLIFPEGTSSDGSDVLRFHAPLFAPAIRATATATSAAIGYSAGTLAVEADLCYYGDISFAPHLLQILQLPEISAMVSFADSGRLFADRKDAAATTRAEVVELRRGLGLASGGAHRL